MTPEQRVAAHFQWQADAALALGSPLYSVLLHRCADDLLAGGPTASVMAGALGHRRRDAAPLRLLAGVHALVLTGRAPQLAPHFPSVGGTVPLDEEHLWEAFREALVDDADEVRGWLDRPPQTNEVGRGAALAGALCHLVAEVPLPVRLTEIGASAGLNLRADRFRIEGEPAASGPPASPLVLRDAWRGAVPPDVQVDVVDRVGIDLAPIDPTTEGGRLRLTAFVWADQVDRLDRLRGALDLARQVPAELRTGDAIDAVRVLQVNDGTWTVLWHSVFRQYLDNSAYAELAVAVAAVGATATEKAPFAHVHLEPEPTSPADGFPVTLTTWPGARRRVLGTAPAHGLPVTWTG